MTVLVYLQIGKHIIKILTLTDFYTYYADFMFI
jgi:hypothetical protein